MNDFLDNHGLGGEFQKEIESFVSAYISRTPAFSAISAEGVNPDNFERILGSAVNLEDFYILSKEAVKRSLPGAITVALYKKWSEASLALVASANHPLELIAVMSLSPYGERSFVLAIDRAIKMISERPFGLAVTRKVVTWAVYHSRISPQASEALLRGSA